MHTTHGLLPQCPSHQTWRDIVPFCSGILLLYNSVLPDDLPKQNFRRNTIHGWKTSGDFVVWRMDNHYSSPCTATTDVYYPGDNLYGLFACHITCIILGDMRWCMAHVPAVDRRTGTFRQTLRSSPTTTPTTTARHSLTIPDLGPYWVGRTDWDGQD